MSAIQAILATSEDGMSQTPTKIVLTRARGMIADESRWLQGDWSDTSEGYIKRCAYQAVEDAATALGLDCERPLAHLVGPIGEDGDCPRDTIPEFNDEAEHGDVMALFDLALETA